MELKKEFLICLIIIFFIIFLDIVLNNHFFYQKEKMNKEIFNLQEIILNEEDGENEIENLNRLWQEFSHIAAWYTEHNELEKISLKISLIKNNIETGQNDMTIEYLEEVHFWLEHIFEKDKLKLKNIF